MISYLASQSTTSRRFLLDSSSQKVRLDCVERRATRTHASSAESASTLSKATLEQVLASTGTLRSESELGQDGQGVQRVRPGEVTRGINKEMNEAN